MRVLAEIRWCETHGREEGWPNCPEKGSKETCVVVDAQVTRTTAGSTPRPYKQPCPDCDGTGYVGPEPGTHGMSADCPSCSVEPKQTEQNTLVIERSNDEWPEWTKKECSYLVTGDESDITWGEVLDMLVRAQAGIDEWAGEDK